MIASDLKTEENREFIICASSEFIDAFEKALKEYIENQVLIKPIINKRKKKKYNE